MDNIELYLQNNDNLLPRDQVKITNVTATPYPDGRRVNVAVEITPFRERPNLEIAIHRADGDRTPHIVASTSVIAIMNFRVDFNLHLRGVVDPAGRYTVSVGLYYEDAQSPQHTRSIDLIIAPAQAE
jgi:hypothetical protein